MTADSRQQKRKFARERLKAGQRTMTRGLATTPAKDDVMAVAEVVRARLAEHDNPRRSGEAAELAQGLAERSLKAFPPKLEIACTKGCAYCCHLMVAVMAPEAFRIADAVRSGRRPGLDVEGVQARAKPLMGVGPEQRLGAKLPCPLLVDGRCGVYAERPLTCRQTTSRSVASCIEEFEGGAVGGTIEASSGHLAHASNAHVVLLGAMKAVGLPTESYELGAILDTVLSLPDAEARWLSGEAIFAHIPPAPQRSREIELVATRIAAELNG